MMPAEVKDVPVTVSSAAKPKFDLDRDFPYRRMFVRTAAEAAGLRAIYDRLAALRNAPEPNVDADEEAELPDLEIGSLELEPTKLIPPVEEKLLSDAELEVTQDTIYCVDTGEAIANFNVTIFSGPYDEEWLDEITRYEEAVSASQSSQLVAKDKNYKLSLQSGVKSLKYDIPRSNLPYAAYLRGLLTFLKSKKVIHDYTFDSNTILIDTLLGLEELENLPQSSQPVTENDKLNELSLQSGVKSLKYNIPRSNLPYAAYLSDLLVFLRSKKVIHDYTFDNNTFLIDTLLGPKEVESPPPSSQPVAKDDESDELFLQSGEKSLKYNKPSSTLPHAADINDLLIFMRSKRIIDDFIVDNNTIFIYPFRGSEEENTQPSSQLVAKDDKNDELSLQSGVRSTPYNIPSSSLPNAADLSDLLTFLRSKKVVHDFIVDNNMISIQTLNSQQQKSIGKVPESFPPGKPGISGSLKETVTMTYPKQAMESQPSTSGLQKGQTDTKTTKLSIAQVTKSPTVNEELELRYPHKYYRYLSCIGFRELVYTKDYCTTCDPRYRRDRKTWLLHAKNRHYDALIKTLYF